MSQNVVKMSTWRRGLFSQYFKRFMRLGLVYKPKHSSYSRSNSHSSSTIDVVFCCSINSKKGTNH